MPRGEGKGAGLRSERLGGGAGAAGWCLAEEAGDAIERDVAAFARAWFAGDAPAMAQSLHPDFVNRMMGLREAEDAVEHVVGLQGRFGSKVAPARRSLEVRVLDVRPRSASAVAVLGDWVLHVHLARTGAHWRIVNAMWEMT